MTHVHVWSAARTVSVVIVGILLLASPTYAAQITLEFEGIVDASASGGLANKPYSGFFTWDSTTAPNDVDGTPPVVAEYNITAHQLILDSVDLPGNGGMFMFDGVDFFETGVADGLAMLAEIGSFLDGSTPVTRFLIVGLTGDPGTWDAVQPLPGDLAFLSKLTTRFAAFVDEYPGGDENDVLLGTGTLTITRASITPVPEPATLTLTVLGLGTLVTRVRRARQSKS